VIVVCGKAVFINVEQQEMAHLQKWEYQFGLKLEIVSLLMVAVLKKNKNAVIEIMQLYRKSISEYMLAEQYSSGAT
jgi:hypothetical protein